MKVNNLTEKDNNIFIRYKTQTKKLRKINLVTGANKGKSKEDRIQPVSIIDTQCCFLRLFGSLLVNFHVILLRLYAIGSLGSS